MAPLINEEIQIAIFVMEKDKTSGLHGLPCTFLLDPLDDTKGGCNQGSTRIPKT